MARVKFGAIVTDGRGSLAGHTFQNSLGGMQMRTKPVIKAKPSSAQQLIRSYNPQLQQGWRDLTELQRSQWNSYSRNHQVFNSSGDYKPLSGHSLWMKFQFAYISSGLTFEPNVYLAVNGPLSGNLILNPTFVGWDPWFHGSGWSLCSPGASFDAVITSTISQAVNAQSSVTYTFSFDITDSGGSGRLEVRNQNGNPFLAPPFPPVINLYDGHFSYNAAPVEDNTLISFLAFSWAGSFCINNISLIPV